jgi:hypothetical protein
VGTWSTQVVLWDITDATKEGDTRYWVTEREIETTRRGRARPLDPEIVARAEAVWGPMSDSLSDEEIEKLEEARIGKPKGVSLEKLRERSGGEVVVDGPNPEGETEPAQIPLPPELFAGSDPLTTYVIASRHYAWTPEEREAMPKWKYPPEVDELRKEWVAALDSGAPEEPQLRERYDEELEKLGGLKHTTFSAWLPERAAELTPGVFVQDERPGR